MGSDSLAEFELLVMLAALRLGIEAMVGDLALGDGRAAGGPAESRA